MGANPAGEFPYPLNGIQIRTVWWKKIKPKDFSMVVQPRSKITSMMPSCIIQNDKHKFVSSAMPQKLFQERKKGHCVKPVLKTCGETPVMKADRAEHSDAFASRCMQNKRVHILRRHPHNTTGSVLLKMAFILKPQINVVSPCETQEFFYMRVAPPDLLEQLSASVCACENRVD
jgi:hypothetical protein